jgi:hypothetical protein
MSDEIRSIKIMGGAKEDYLKTGTRRKKQKGGDVPPPAPLSAGANAPSPTISPSDLTPASTGGASIQKVVESEKEHKEHREHKGEKPERMVLLEKKKKSSMILTRKDPRKKRFSGQIGQTRKLRIHMGGLRTRMTRAKSIHRNSESEPINKVLNTLVSAGLIKGGGKEPSEEREKILRGIYRDYLQLRSNSL